MRVINLFVVSTMLVMLLLFVLSCTKGVKNTPNDAPALETEQPHAQTTSGNGEGGEVSAAAGEGSNTVGCTWFYSADLVFLSDPIFALQFITNARANYSEFYAMALTKQMDARMFVSVEEAAAAALGFSKNGLPENIQKNFKPLSERQLSTAVRARLVVLSPLMRLFAPEQVERIEARRAQCGASPMRTLDGGGYTSALNNTIKVRYKPAVEKLASTIADYMQEKNLKGMVAILDEPTRRNVEDMSVLISLLKNRINAFKVRLLWKKRNSDSEGETFTQLDGITDNEVVLLHAGMYTSRAAQYLRERESVEKARIFAMLTWQHLPYSTQHAVSYGVHAAAWVAAPLSALFENKNYVNAKLYRDL